MELEIPKEMNDHLSVLMAAASKGLHKPNNWLEPDGKGCSHKEMYASIFRHVAEAYSNKKLDEKSGLDVRLHAAVRLMMDYTREKLNIKHPLDTTLL